MVKEHGRHLGAAVLLSWMLLGFPAAAEDTASGQPGSVLEPGTAIERQAAAGDIHRYRVGRISTPYLRVAVEQRGADVVVTVADTEGRRLAAVDHPDDRQGTESLVVPAAAGGYRLEVRAKTRGRYRIAAEGLADATPAERQRIAAERYATTGAELHLEGTAEAWRQAIPQYRKARDLWRALARPRDEARALHSLGWLHLKLEETEEALKHLRLALPLWSAAGDVAGEAGTRSLLGYVHRSRGEIEPALELYGQALAIRRQSGDRCGQAWVLNNLGAIALHRGEPRQALESYDRARALCGEADDPALSALVLMNLGGVSQQLGDLHGARDHYARALPLLRSLGRRKEEAITRQNMGVYSRRLGDYEQAFEHYRAALEIARQTGDRRRQATVLNSLGYAHLSLGEAERALTYLRQALPLRREVGDRRGEAATLNSLGKAYQRLGEPRQALDFYRRALKAYQAIEFRRGEAASHNLIGSVHTELGEPAAAVAAFERALELQRAAEDLYTQSLSLRLLAEAHLAAGDPRRAVEPLRRSLELSRRLKDRLNEARTAAVLGRAERRLGELASARSHLEAALEILEGWRAGIGDPEIRASFFAAERQAYEATVDLWIDLHRREPGAGHDRRALEISEQARARTLLELVAEAGGPIRQGVDRELAARRRTLQQRLNVQAGRQRRLLSRPHSGEQALAMEGEVQELLGELRSVEGEIRRRSPAYAALTRPRTLAAGELQRLLDPGTVLLQYALGEERSFLWAVTPDSISSHVLPPRREIETAARHLHERWSALDIGGRRATAAAAATLSRQILSPAGEMLASAERLVIVADGALHYLPFHALPAPAAATGEPLLAGHQIVHLPSASVLAEQRRSLAGRRPASRGVAVVADPIFAADDPRITAAGTAGPTADRTVSRSPEATPAGFERLPSSRLEAEAIAALMPGETLTLLDARAARAAVVGGSLDGHRILHFATHGVLDSERPQLSGLVLSLYDEAGRPVDGFLAVHEIYNLRLAADLVVLSGCRTALGKEIRGEGLLGLTRGFLYAGAARVVASLWQVQDRATAELMTRFYRALVAGRPAAAALRAAQLGMWRETEWKDPYYWAGFVLQGDWR